MALSILFYILAAHKIIKNEKVQYIKVIILLFLGLISYQGTISAFFMFVLLFSMINNSNKATIKKLIISVAMFIIVFVMNNICIWIVEVFFGTKQVRVGKTILEIMMNIIVIILNIDKVIIYNSNLFPQYLYISFIAVTTIVLYFKIVNQNKENYSKKNELILLEQLTIIICSILFAFIPSIYSTTAFETARIRFSIGATIGCIFMHLAVKTDFLKKNKIIDKILMLIFIIYGITNTINYVYLIHLNKWVNQIDREEVYKIDNYINNYEEENKLQVNNIKLVIIPENIDKAYYSEMNATEVGIAVSSIRTKWATQGIINYYTDRNLKEEELKKEEKEKYLREVDEELGYLCIGDTLYVSVYWY